MATYIDFTPDDEQALLLTQFLHSILKAKGKEPNESFADDCAKLVSETKYAELWSKLLDESSILFSETPEKGWLSASNPQTKFRKMWRDSFIL